MIQQIKMNARNLFELTVGILASMLLAENSNGVPVSTNFNDVWADVIIGTDDDNNLVGTINSDMIKGGPGSDNLFGEGGNDKLFAGSGNDDLMGESGSDYFDCGDGIDEILDFDPQEGDMKTGNCEYFE